MSKQLEGVERVMLDPQEAIRIADRLAMHYEFTKESAYQQTDEQAARDAMMIRELAGITPNPELLEGN